MLSFFLKQHDTQEYVYREVVQKPISPAYKEILDKLKNCSIKHAGITVKYEETETKNDEETIAQA